MDKMIYTKLKIEVEGLDKTIEKASKAIELITEANNLLRSCIYSTTEVVISEESENE